MDIRHVTDDVVEQWSAPEVVASASAEPEPIGAVIERLYDALGIVPLHTVKSVQDALADHPLDHLLPADYSWDPRA